MKFSNINSDKNLYQYLSKIYGIGKKNSLRVCDFLGLCKNTKYKNYSRISLDRIDFYIQQNFYTESEYKNLVQKDIARHIEISSFRGIRHSRGLPCRGQRTHGNAKTVRRTRNF